MFENGLDRERNARHDRIRRELLKRCELADEREAWTLLGKPGFEPAEAMGSLSDNRAVLRLFADGHYVYPSFQFDPKTKSLLPGMRLVLQAKPDSYSDYLLLSWLLCPHLDFGTSPAESLQDLPNEVMTAFYREIEPVSHG